MHRRVAGPDGAAPGAILGILFAGSQFIVPNRESKASLVVRTILVLLGLASLIMMLIYMFKIISNLYIESIWGVFLVKLIKYI